MSMIEFGNFPAGKEITTFEEPLEVTLHEALECIDALLELQDAKMLLPESSYEKIITIHDNLIYLSGNVSYKNQVLEKITAFIESFPASAEKDFLEALDQKQAELENSELSELYSGAYSIFKEWLNYKNNIQSL